MVEYTKYCNWTEKDRNTTLIENTKYISKVLSNAKIRYINELVGTPIEITFQNNLLIDWRILTEIL